VSVDAIKRRMKNGDWLLLTPGVYALRSSRDTFERLDAKPWLERTTRLALLAPSSQAAVGP